MIEYIYSQISSLREVYNMSKVGENIKKARNEKGMSQKQLAKKLGVSESFINEVESGRKVINEKLIERIGKVLGGDIQNMTSMFQNIAYEESKNESVTPKNKAPETVKDVWNDAFGSILKTIGVYKYDLDKPIANRQMPIISNKIEGYNSDKVLFIEIENDDLMGFRICKGDIAFANLTTEIENNAICLIDYNGERVLRQIKKLDSNKVLLISNRGSLRTETLGVKDIKVVAKLNRVEIIL
jgi:transcriptional regulator with XRE-family HTH domain